MTNKEVYKIWAPSGCDWTDWVRPVPFIDINDHLIYHEAIDYTIPKINYIKEKMNDTVLIIDIQGVNSVKEGIALAKLGYRPIPIFNGTNPPINTKSTTNNSIIQLLLVWGALELKNIKIENDASPVFLLDSNRLNRYKSSRGIFDNSWDIYPQDIPSKEYLVKKGIKKIIIRGEKLNSDLSKVLYKYQKDLKILFTDGFEEPKEIKIPKLKETN